MLAVERRAEALLAVAGRTRPPRTTAAHLASHPRRGRLAAACDGPVPRRPAGRRAGRTVGGPPRPGDRAGRGPGPEGNSWKPTSWPRRRTSPGPRPRPPSRPPGRPFEPSGRRPRPVRRPTRSWSGCGAPPTGPDAPSPRSPCSAARRGPARPALAKALTRRLAAKAGPRRGNAGPSTRGRPPRGRGPRSPTRRRARRPGRRPRRRPGDGWLATLTAATCVCREPRGRLADRGGRRAGGRAAGPRRLAPRRRRHPGPADRAGDAAGQRAGADPRHLPGHRDQPGADRHPGPRRPAGAGREYPAGLPAHGDRRAGRRRRRGGKDRPPPGRSTSAAAVTRSSSANWPSCTRTGQAGLAAVPPGVGDVIRHRLPQLPAAARTVLRQAAVLGRDLDPDVLGALAGDPTAALDAVDAPWRPGSSPSGTRRAAGLHPHSGPRHALRRPVRAAPRRLARGRRRGAAAAGTRRARRPSRTTCCAPAGRSTPPEASSVRPARPSGPSGPATPRGGPAVGPGDRRVRQRRRGRAAWAGDRAARPGAGAGR